MSISVILMTLIQIVRTKFSQVTINKLTLLPFYASLSFLSFLLIQTTLLILRPTVTKNPGLFVYRLI